jgi:hypothetical protein
MNTVVNLPQSSDAASARPADAQHAGADAHTATASAAVNTSSRRQQRPAAAPTAPHSPFVPVLLGGLALLGWLGFQTYGLVTERTGLASARTAQQQTVDNAGKLRTSLDALAADTQRIADAGNPSARLLIDELRKRGITINAPAAVATKPATN